MNQYRTIAHFLALSFLLATSFVAVADKTVSGQVIAGGNSSGLAGVVVSVNGSDQSTTTDQDGRYTLEIPDNATLRFTVDDVAAQEVEVGDQTEIDVTIGF